jgi:hypothetical protein
VFSGTCDLDLVDNGKPRCLSSSNTQPRILSTLYPSLGCTTGHFRKGTVVEVLEFPRGSNPGRTTPLLNLDHLKEIKAVVCSVFKQAKKLEAIIIIKGLTWLSSKLLSKLDLSSDCTCPGLQKRTCWCIRGLPYFSWTRNLCQGRERRNFAWTGSTFLVTLLRIRPPFRVENSH